jgi:DNA polymerase-3 subunit alpha
VVGIVYEFDKGWWAITAEDFVVTRSESFEGTYNLLDGGRHFDHFPSMSDLVIPPDATTKDTFVHLHTHSHYSPLDGLTTIEEMVESVKGHGQRAVAVTDHGICAGHPDLQLVADKHGIKPIFGLEAYFVEDRLERPAPGDKEAQERLSDYWHLILLAKDDEGLGNLWAASTESYRDGKYKKPRLDWDTLRRHHKGLIATSACLRGPLAHHGLGGQRSEPTEEEATATRARLGQLLEIFGEDFYIEIQTGQTPLQMTLNHRLIELAQEYNVPMIAAADSHYQLPTDKYAHQVWLRAQTNSDIAEDSSLFGSGDDYHISSEEEVRQDLASQGIPEDVIDVAIANTARIAEQCTAKIVARKDMPVYSKTGGHQADQDRLLDLCLKAWPKTVGKRHPHSVYETRLAKEFQLLKDKNYCGYFLVVWDYCRYARSKKILIGPGRGSGAGSLIAYLLGITGVDPVDSGLLFERFLTEGRMSLPDFDVDFPASKKREMQQYIRDRYGDQNVAVVGSSLKHKNKSIVKSLGMTLKSQLPADAFGDLNDVCKIIDMAEADTAGLGMSWEALWAQHDDVLRPYRQKYPEVFKLADRLVGRVRTYGQHAAGMVISPDGSLVNQLPMRAVKDESGEEHMVTQLDGATLEQLGFIKADLLTLRNLDTIQATIDLIRERRGLEVWPDDWRAEYEDPQVWEQICEAHTMGIFQIETRAGTQLVKRVQPTSLAELADIMTLVRPGPTRSGLTETYLRRRAGQEEVSYPDPRLEAVLADTYGAIIYQEQVMAATMELAGYTSTEADDVRRILGKKKVEKTQEAGQEFVSRATIDREVAEQLWLQMAEFAKYAFNKSHSYSYAALAYWTAWLKFHFPVEFLAMALSTVDKDRIPDFVKETRRMGYAVLPPDINRSGTGFRAADLGVRYGLDSIKGVGPAAVKSILENQEFETWEDFTSRRGRATHAGVVSLLAQVGAFDDLVPNRRGLVVLLQNEKDGTASQCVFKNTEVDGPGGLPCTFDWSTEPPNINPRTGKTLKPKPLPKKCTRACRNFTPSPPLDITAVQPYSRTQVRELEMNLLGVYLSSTPFDDLQPEDRQLTLSYAQALAQPGAPVKNYVVAGIITKARPYVPPSTGRTMGFVAMETEVETLDIAVFAPLWERFSRDLTVGTFGVAQIKHEDDGRNHLVDYQPVR